MKKFFAIAILFVTLISSSSTAFAATHVSETAVTMGGKAVAECAQMMEKGVSACVNGSACNMQ